MGTLVDLLVVQKCQDVAMTVELIKAHINLQARPLSMHIYRITERPRRLISRPSRSLQLAPSALPPLWSRVSPKALLDKPEPQ